MMPVIRISDLTWERMKQHARPFEDSPEDIVKLGLDALDKLAGRSITPVDRSVRTIGRPSKGSAGVKLPQKEFREPLLLLLYELGGSAGLAELREGLLPRMQSRLGEADYSIVSTGEPRWWNATCWERSDMVKEGLLRGDSPRGRWELSEDGRRAAARLANS
ncbi:MAG TPA: winged helix-turn-helix domain-containing protein [Allosphingosinicella sp.]|nr:winged helix-turn-helix domain-containing protein [Allosphingosinicella sp.]